MSKHLELRESGVAPPSLFSAGGARGGRPSALLPPGVHSCKDEKDLSVGCMLSRSWANRACSLSLSLRRTCTCCRRKIIVQNRRLVSGWASQTRKDISCIIEMWTSMRRSCCATNSSCILRFVLSSTARSDPARSHAACRSRVRKDSPKTYICMTATLLTLETSLGK